MKTIIFDLDGTLVNSIDDLAASCNAALKTYGYPTHKTCEYPHFVGRGIRNLVRQAMPTSLQNDEEKVTDCFNTFYGIYKENCLIRTAPYDGIKHLLTELKKKGMKIGVLSNKSHELVQIVVNKLFEEGTFDIALGTSDTLERKPSPDGIYRICEHFSIQKDDTMLIGDSLVDINTARNAGIKIAAVTWGFQPASDLSAAKPDYLLDSPKQVLSIV